VQALGGAAALQKITSRSVKGSRIGADGVLVPEEVHQKAPDKFLTVTTYPNVVFSNGVNGTVVWAHSSREGATPLPEQLAVQLKRDAVFHKELKTQELYSKLTVLGKTSVRDADAYVVQAQPAEGPVEKLFFDVKTGLLVRRYVETDTGLGKLPLQTDYEDYRVVDGIKQPFLIHWSMPGRIWGRKIEEIKQNIALDDAKFNPVVPRSELLARGYIAARSGHSRGSTVDITLVKLPAQLQPRWDGRFRSCIAPYRRRFADTSVNMGTSYDCMDPRAATFHPAIKGVRRSNRLRLKRALERVGFAYYSKEWWHFTLRSEPYPERYFNFPVDRESVK